MLRMSAATEALRDYRRAFAELAGAIGELADVHNQAEVAVTDSVTGIVGLVGHILDGAAETAAMVRILMIAPFFVMPTVSALVWKNMFMNPVNGLLAWLQTSMGFTPHDWLATTPLAAIIVIVAAAPCLMNYLLGNIAWKTKNFYAHVRSIHGDA